MGYDASVELRDVNEREAYDRAAEIMRIPHEIETWGDGEPSEWQVKMLWSGGSLTRDLAEHLERGGKRADMKDSEYCSPTIIRPEALSVLGKIAVGLRRAFPEQMAMIDSLSLLEGEDCYELWGMLERGVVSTTRKSFSIPVPSRASIPSVRGTITRDDRSAPVPHGDSEVWDAYMRYLSASHAASEAEAGLRDCDDTEDADAVAARMAELTERRDEAKREYDKVRPSQDTVSVGGTSLEVTICDHYVTVEEETCNRFVGLGFKSAVAGIIRDAIGDTYDVGTLYDILSSEPGLMLGTFSRLGDIGDVAREAGIKELILEQSW